jgi:translation initiation factor IF-2
VATKKIRIYELARELGISNEEVLDLANELKIGVKSHSSSIEEPMADRVRRLADSRGLRRESEPEPEPEKAEPRRPPRGRSPPAATPAPPVVLTAELDSPPAEARTAPCA